MRKPLLILLLTASVATAGCGCGAGWDDVQKMGRRVETELPIGSTEVHVAKFLDDMHLQHGEPIVAPDDPIPSYRKLRQTGATIENFWHNEPAMYLQFYFDNNGKLVESKVWNACGLGCYSVRPNNTLDRSGGSVFRNLIELKVGINRRARSLTLCCR